MPILKVAIVTSLVTALFLPASSRAGGWWSFIDLESSYVMAGKRMQAHTEFLFRSLDLAEQARSKTFHAYLIADWDPTILHRAMGQPEPRGWWDLAGARAIRVGTVELDGWNANLATASTDFVVPDIGPGRYRLMFCDAGCKHALGDIVPVTVKVVSDPAIPRLDGAVDRMRSKLQKQQARLAVAERKATNARDQLKEVWARTALLAARPNRTPERNGVPWWAFAGWFVAGASLSAATVSAVRRRRLWDQFRPESLPPAPEQPERERIPAGRI